MQNIFSNEYLLQKLPEFLQLWENRPIKDNKGGMGVCHSFYVWLVVKKLRPKYIIESGVWHGHSTWLLEQSSSKGVKIFSLDPLNQFAYVSQTASYFTGHKFKDFVSIDWATLIPNEMDRSQHTLCFFDDHYGKDRIYQAHKLGFKHLIFDDNYAKFGGNQHNPRGNDFAPKALLALPQNMETRQHLETLMHTYFEFPPIVANLKDKSRCFWQDIKEYTKTPLLSFDKATHMLKEDAKNYTWICYIRLV